MGLRSLKSKVEGLERRHRPMGRRIVAVLPTGERYILDGPRIVIPPRRRRKGTRPVEGGPDWLGRQPGSWRRVRPSDGPLDDAKIYYVNTLLCFARDIPFAGGGPQRLTIDPAKVRESRKSSPIARSRD